MKKIENATFFLNKQNVNNYNWGSTCRRCWIPNEQYKNLSRQRSTYMYVYIENLSKNVCVNTNICTTGYAKMF